ncbi:hypothetical protein [Corallococcus exiguus]|uniref:hypothetical protein n=1 Tax=Corallococcus exiguus TaxID=83462 RepID=UPI003DA32859
MGIQSTTAASTFRAPTSLGTGPTAVPSRPATPAPVQRAPLSYASRDSFAATPTSRGPNLTGTAPAAPLSEAPTSSSLVMRAISTGGVQKTPQAGGVSIPFRIKLTGLSAQQRKELTPGELLVQFAMQYNRVDRTRAEAMVAAKEVGWTNGTPEITDAIRNGAFYEINVTDASLKPLSPKDEKAVDGLLNGLPPGDKKRLKSEANKEFESRTNGIYRGTPQDKAYLKNIEGDLLAKELFKNVPPHVRDILFKEGAPAPKDYASALRAAEALSKLSPLELADYLSKTTGTTSDWAALDKSIDSYRADRAERLQGLEALDGYSKRLEGTAALYEELKAYDYRTNNPPALAAEDSNELTQHLNKLDGMRANLASELQRHGISSIEEFRGLLSGYRTSFEKETVSVAKELMARTDHSLYELQNKYQDPAVAQDLYQRLAKAREYEAKAVEAETTAATLKQGAVDSPRLQPPQILRQAEEARNEARSFRAQAREEANRIARDHPLLRDEKLDLRTLVQARPEGIQALIQKHLATRRQDIQKTRSNIEQDPSLIYGFDVLMKSSKQLQGIQPGSVQDLVINDRGAEIQRNEKLIDLGLSAMGLAVGLIPGGAAVLPIILAGGIGAAQVVRKAQDYMVQDAAHGAGLLKDDPSMAEVVMAVVETGFDLAAAGPLLDAVKAFRMSKAKDLGKLEKELKTLPDVSDALAGRIVDVERRGLSQAATQGTKSVDTAVTDLRKVMRAYANEEVDGAALRAAYLRSVEDAGGDARVRATLGKLKDSVLREAFGSPEALLAAAASKDPKQVEALLSLLERQVGRDSADVVMSNAVRDVAGKAKVGVGRVVTDPKEIQRLFREKFGGNEAVFYRGIRVQEGAQLQGTYKGAQGGQMLSDSKSAALTYANQAPGLKAGRDQATKRIVIEVRIRPEDILQDPYGTMEHVILKPGVDLTKLPGYRQLTPEEIANLK